MNTLPELQDLYKLEELCLPDVSFNTVETISYKGCLYPIRSIVIGSNDKSLPTIGLFGGVHGLERIGSQVLIAFLHSLFQQLIWDRDLQSKIKKFRIVCIPIINPAGMARSSRSNPNNVDLMRNSPVKANGRVLPLISGHRISPYLPWYQGQEGILEKESLALIKFVKEEIFSSKVSLAMDVHSGFGLRDQIWYPYAHSSNEFPLRREALLLKGLLDKTYPYHIYKFEAQSENYLNHGDLWDYLFELHRDQCQDKGIFLPLTLELGSWNWIRKNPLQFFSKTGLFHPVKEHRHARIMRRHLLLFDFLINAINNFSSWNPPSTEN